MKRNILIIVGVLLASGASLKAQVAYSTEANDSTNIYYQSLRLYCDYLDEHFPKVKEVILEEDAVTTKSIPDKMGNLDIVKINSRYLKKRYKRSRGSLYLTRIVPLRMKGDEFFINVIPFKVGYHKRSFRFTNGGAVVAKYKYDCENKKFIQTEVEGGISNLE